jgi:hypothetical protein
MENNNGFITLEEFNRVTSVLDLDKIDTTFCNSKCLIGLFFIFNESPLKNIAY